MFGEDRFELVEPNGCVYAFSAKALARLFVCSARFAHPATRRLLHAAEVARLQRRLPAPVAALVAWTSRYAEPARQALDAMGSISEHLAAEAGRRLDGMLEAAEFGELFEVDERGEGYARAVLALARHDGAAARRLLHLHRDLCARRRDLCTPDSYYLVEEVRADLEEQSKRWPSKRPPSTAAEAWLQECASAGAASAGAASAGMVRRFFR